MSRAKLSKQRLSSVQSSPLIDWVVGGGERRGGEGRGGGTRGTLQQRWGGGGRDMRDASAEIVFQSFRAGEAIVSSSGMHRDVYSLTLSIQHSLCQP